MTPENKNKAVVKSYVDAFNSGDMDALRQVFSADAEVHGVMGWGTIEWAMPIWRELHNGLQINLQIDEFVAENNRVAVRYTERGAWVAPFLGHEAPTGKSFELSAMEWFVIDAGKIRRRWGVRDSASQARQIGL